VINRELATCLCTLQIGCLGALGYNTIRLHAGTSERGAGDKLFWKIKVTHTSYL
jgi:hypothetical protein